MGHAYSTEDTNKRGQHSCRQCSRARNKLRYDRDPAYRQDTKDRAKARQQRKKTAPCRVVEISPVNKSSPD
jgi:hypothetical protein